ncbi:hypothetical protein F5Y16DRAFT_400688 [Xylariaceae sp. FL0255]|nr:hypothetical protein F5Y16DRAFT_400688 [Xylariaceae sp. FL0255]
MKIGETGEDAIDGKVDITSKYANTFANDDTYTPQVTWKLLWKLDARLVPLLWLNITLDAMDNVTTATAAL